MPGAFSTKKQIQMKNIDQVLQDNHFAVQTLLRRSHVNGPVNMDSIQKGFEKHGENFMLKLLAIITPTESAFTDLITPRPANLIATAPDSKTLAGQPSGKAWTFWEKLLGAINKTGETIGKFKDDATGTEAPPVTEAQAVTSKTIYIVAAAFVALIVIILIVRK